MQYAFYVTCPMLFVIRYTVYVICCTLNVAPLTLSDTRCKLNDIQYLLVVLFKSSCIIRFRICAMRITQYEVRHTLSVYFFYVIRYEGIIYTLHWMLFRMSYWNFECSS